MYKARIQLRKNCCYLPALILVLHNIFNYSTYTGTKPIKKEDVYGPNRSVQRHGL
jgi:hypothetical protein